MTYADRLRHLALNDANLGAELGAEMTLGPRALAMVRLAALVAIGGAEPSYGSEVDDALAVGLTPAEIVDVLAGVTPIVGLPIAVAAAEKVALALGVEVLGVDGGDVFG